MSEGSEEAAMTPYIRKNHLDMTAEEKRRMERHPDVPHYLPAEDTTDVPGPHTPLGPWHTMAPATLLDHTRWYRYDN
jgi:hypothetical protein